MTHDGAGVLVSGRPVFAQARLVELNATLVASTAVLAQLQLQTTSLDEAIAAKVRVQLTPKRIPVLANRRLTISFAGPVAGCTQRASAERLLPQLVHAGLDPGLFGGVDGLCTPETVEYAAAARPLFSVLARMLTHVCARECAGWNCFIDNALPPCASSLLCSRPRCRRGSPASMHKSVRRSSSCATFNKPARTFHT